ADHQQAQVGDEVIGELAIADVGAGNVEAEVLAAQAAAVGEVDFEVELDAMLHEPGLHLSTADSLASRSAAEQPRPRRVEDKLRRARRRCARRRSASRRIAASAG